MKLISPDKTFIYYFYDRPDGKSEGIRFGRSTGVAGFVSNTPAAQQTHPIPFLMNDNAIQLPINRENFPPILLNVLSRIEDDHPEIHDILSGRISFDDALNY